MDCFLSVDQKGPAMKPIKVNSLENDVFGKPMDGVKTQGHGVKEILGAPSYAGYTAQMLTIDKVRCSFGWTREVWCDRCTQGWLEC